MSVYHSVYPVYPVICSTLDIQLTTNMCCSLFTVLHLNHDFRLNTQWTYCVPSIPHNIIYKYYTYQSLYARFLFYRELIYYSCNFTNTVNVVLQFIISAIFFFFRLAAIEILTTAIKLIIRSIQRRRKTTTILIQNENKYYHYYTISYIK